MRRHLVGTVFGRLTVIEFSHTAKSKSFWRCKCSCGNETLTPTGYLTSGDTTSCGCAKRDATVERNKAGGTHNRSRTPEHRVWSRMRSRCTRPTDKDYPRYGGRGIKVCPEWSDFSTFFKDMGTRPSGEHSIERLNVNGDYEHANCVWALPVQQANNRRDTRRILFDGRTQSIAQWARELGMREDTLRRRLDHYGFTVTQALTQPVALRSHSHA